MICTDSRKYKEKQTALEPVQAYTIFPYSWLSCQWIRNDFWPFSRDYHYSVILVKGNTVQAMSKSI